MTFALPIVIVPGLYVIPEYALLLLGDTPTIPFGIERLALKDVTVAELLLVNLTKYEQNHTPGVKVIVS